MVKSVFYKDDEGVIKGPFTEKKVQEGYRKAWFESATVFYFSTSEEHPANTAEGKTLEQLIELNGHGSPFEGAPERSIPTRLEAIKQKTSDLQKQQGNFDTLLERIENVERKLEALSTSNAANSSTEYIEAKTSKMSAILDGIDKTIQSVLSDSSPWEAKSEESPVAEPQKQIVQSDEPERRTDGRMIFNSAATFIVDFYEILRTADFDQMPSFYSGGILKMNEECIQKSEETQQTFFKTLCAIMKEKDYFFCSACSYTMLNYKHALIHLLDPDHFKKIALLKFEPLIRLSHFISSIIVNQTKKLDLYLEWKDAERKAAAEKAKYVKNADGKDRVPSLEFAREMVMRYGEEVFEFKRVNPFGPSFIVIEQGLPRLKRGDTAKRIMSFIHQHVSSGQPTACPYCSVATGSADGFYDHILSYAHLKQAQCYDLLTIVINMLKKKD